MKFGLNIMDILKIEQKMSNKYIFNESMNMHKNIN